MNELKLLGSKEIASLLGVTRAHFVDRISKKPTFPKPIINTSQRIRKWNRDDVFKWLTK